MSEMFPQILNLNDRYCFTGPNEVKFITGRQTMSIVLGSCISTVFIGKKEGYILAANHIVIAEPNKDSIVAKKGAQTQIDEIFDIFKNAFDLEKEDIRCLHVLGSGKKVSGESFSVHTNNVIAVSNILDNNNFIPVFNDTDSHFFASYSISEKNLSIFIENKITPSHISITLNLDNLFNLKQEDYELLPASMLVKNKSFESLVEKEVITFITGKKNR